MKFNPLGTLAVLATATLSFLVPTGIAHASTVTDVAITYGGGSVYSSGNWSDAINGSSIITAPTNGNQGTGITFADWAGQFNEIDSGVNRSFSTGSIALTANSVVNTLINTFYGDSGIDGVVTFTNSNGDTAVFSLVGDQTVRDYNQAFYANDLQGFNTNSGLGKVTTQNWWNNGTPGQQNASQRLDVQTFVLPTSWDGTDLTSMNISVSSDAFADDVLSAVQVVTDVPRTSPVPEPSSFMLLGTGLLGAAGAIRRRFRS